MYQKGGWSTLSSLKNKGEKGGSLPARGDIERDSPLYPRETCSIFRGGKASLSDDANHPVGLGEEPNHRRQHS